MHMASDREYLDLKGNKIQVGCMGCDIQQGKIKHPSGAPILLTEHFDAHQDVEIPIPGFVILASRRHFMGVDEMRAEEQKDFIDSLCGLRKAMREILNIQTVYLIQEEDTSHHFHLWMFPRYDWMKEKFGRKIQSVRPVMEYAKESLRTEKNLQEIDETVQKMRNYFKK
jgi:diadenosine tetraphosphate (Ap4A) HIT family hydrolase